MESLLFCFFLPLSASLLPGEMTKLFKSNYGQIGYTARYYCVRRGMWGWGEVCSQGGCRRPFLTRKRVEPAKENVTVNLWLWQIRICCKCCSVHGMTMNSDTCAATWWRYPPIECHLSIISQSGFRNYSFTNVSFIESILNVLLWGKKTAVYLFIYCLAAHRSLYIYTFPHCHQA